MMNLSTTNNNQQAFRECLAEDRSTVILIL